MKSHREIRRSCAARLNKAKRDADTLSVLLGARSLSDGAFWSDIRDLVNSISQCVHEANAYNNIAMGDRVFAKESYIAIQPEPTDASN